MREESLKALVPCEERTFLMAMGFFVLMVLWIVGPLINITAVEGALLGMSFLLICQVFSWSNYLSSITPLKHLFGLEPYWPLQKVYQRLALLHGLVNWVAHHMGGLPAWLGILTLFLIYFYAHYFFASCTAHVGALFLPFVTAIIALGAPSLPAVFAFSFASSLFGSLTHYGIGPAPILFGSGYVTLAEWWRIGFLMSIVSIAIWVSCGGLWWWFLGAF